MPAPPEIEPFHDEATSTMSYVVHGGPGTPCAVIDPVLDFDAKSGRTRTQSADRISACIDERRLRLAWILETHVHADHLTAAPLLKRRHGGQVGIGAGVVAVQRHFARVFAAEPGFPTDGSQFDRLFADGDEVALGELSARVLATPGHTPDGVGYLVGDALFAGDTLFMPDGGTARCDFPGGDPRTLYRSIRRLLALPPATRIFVCHDYQPGGRDLAFETSVAAQRRDNIHVHDGVDEEDFVAMRTARDRALALPALLIPAVQINLRAGAPPPPEPNGVSYLKVPLDLL
jgi:glyoxylase-like metal-dependent hydrolase (beta-lactamase superfamily II)